MAETDVTRMSSDYADNELELFRKTVSGYLFIVTDICSMTYGSHWQYLQLIILNILVLTSMFSDGHDCRVR